MDIQWSADLINRCTLTCGRGREIFVAGTSSVYKRDLRLADAIAQMRKSIE